MTEPFSLKLSGELGLRGIDTLKAQLDAEENVELGLREEIDEGAVRRLLGGAA